MRNLVAGADVPCCDRGSRRWASVGPYYAMFPLEFAAAAIRDHCPPGGTVLDPFAGRGTSIYAAAISGRQALGVEIGALGYVYGATKLAPPPLADVLTSLADLDSSAVAYRPAVSSMPEFFRWAYSDRVLAFLLAARECLDWHGSAADRALMAHLLVYLHGDRGKSLSNQTRRTKSMAPDYSVRWWKARDMRPPDLDPATYISERLAWRYSVPLPTLASASMEMGDCRDVMRRLASDGMTFDMVLTSPPYLGVIDYGYEQWLRLWLLGAAEPEKRTQPERYRNTSAYESLLVEAFAGAKACLGPQGVVYVRTDARPKTRNITAAILQDTFTEHDLVQTARPFGRPTQTALFGDGEVKPGEVDMIMRPRAVSLKLAA